MRKINPVKIIKTETRVNRLETLEEKLPWWIPRIKIYFDGEMVIYTLALIGIVAILIAAL